MRPEDLTPEQRKALIEAGARMTKAAAEIINSMMEAIKPVMAWYNSLPDELKQQIAAVQVGDDHPELVEEKPRNPAEFYHWVDCNKKGIVNVYHVSDCAGGEDCELFRYLSDGKNMEKHLKRGHEYEVIKAKGGGYEFSQTGETGTYTIKNTKREATQTSLLEASS
jgi:hypothetical protein